LLWTVIVIAAIIVLAIGIWFLQRYYAKATLDTALVRTGLGGQRVITDGGCVALPILHQLQRVSMQAMSLSAARSGRDAALTRDQIRADIAMEFELRVMPTAEGIVTAAQALGHRVARNSDAVQELMSGALIDAILAAAARFSLDEIHLDRAAFSRGVSEVIEAQAARLGLTVVSASLVRVDQCDLSQMNENNAFNAKGMRRLAELISAERKARIQVETETEVAVREHQLAQHQRQLELARAEREADIQQQEHLDRLEAEARSRTEQARAQAALMVQTEQIEKERLAKASQVENDEALRRSEMAALLALEETKIANSIRLSEKRIEEATTKAAEEEARAQVILAAEHVQAQKDRAVEKRERELARMRLEKEIELEGARVKSDVDTMLTRAQAEAADRKSVV
jgi:flotillin